MTDIKAILDAWAHAHGVAFVWRADAVIAYTGSRGAWFLSTQALSGDDDWIVVHPTADGCELEKVASAGHVEVLRLSAAELAEALEGVLAWFRDWNHFLDGGPGRGH